VVELLRVDNLLEILGQAGPYGYRFSVSGRGRERAARLVEISGYVGPAPVPLEAYTAMIESSLACRPRLTAEDVETALDDLVLSEEIKETAGLAVMSGRSLFICGPPGNGKTSLGRQLHRAVRGHLWIPHCIAIESSIIQVFDPQIHQRAELAADQEWQVDQRWVRIRPPLIVVGGEATIESFDLAYHAALRYYEAPLQLKANGGLFLIDDFGRQRVHPHELLNRWIIPLENQIDYLTLQTTQKIQVPFRLILVLATNLDPEKVMDPAFLRRMGYRLYLGPPSAEDYVKILDSYAAKRGMQVPPSVVKRLLSRYQAEKRELRACEPRDLIERMCDLCRYKEMEITLNQEIADRAWVGYFGNQPVGE
jgi:predicted ATPase with chaperone activity